MFSYLLGIIKKFGDSPVGDDWYVMIPTSEADTVRKLMQELVDSPEGEWLGFELEPLMNSTSFVLVLKGRY